MRKFYLTSPISAFTLTLFLLAGCKKDEPSTLPFIATSTVTYITATSARSGGNITFDGNSPVISRGVCWSPEKNPTTSDSKTSDETGSGQFASDISGLTPATTYHIRAYATNIIGTSYGSDKTFSSAGEFPNGVTQPATEISSAGAVLNGAVNANFLNTVVSFEYGLTTEYGSTVTATQSPVTGNLNTYVNAKISGLARSKTYHFRLKTVNVLGSIYGCDMEFSTTSGFNPNPWQISDSIRINKEIGFYTGNNKYIVFSNISNDSLFIFDIEARQVIDSIQFKTMGDFVVKENVILIPLTVNSLTAYDITNIKSWKHISDFTGMDTGILAWQFMSSPLSDNNYYWIGHWARTLRIFSVVNNTVIAYDKINVGVNSQAVSHYKNYMYVASNYSNNKRYDITNPAAPVDLGAYGNSNSSFSGVSIKGYLVQELREGWSSTVQLNNIRLYDQDNKILAEIPAVQTLNSHYVIPQGYCFIFGKVGEIYNTNNGSFEYVAELPKPANTSPGPRQFVYNNKYLISKTKKAFYFINLGS